MPNPTPETKEFPIAVLVSLASGKLLCKFGDMQEAAEYLMGHPIWTHQFASRHLWIAMHQRVLEQCPDIPADLDDVTPDNWRERLAAIEAELGTVAVIRKGDGSTAMSPLDGIPEGKPTIILRGA